MCVLMGQIAFAIAPFNATRENKGTETKHHNTPTERHTERERERETRGKPRHPPYQKP